MPAVHIIEYDATASILAFILKNEGAEGSSSIQPQINHTLRNIPELYTYKRSRLAVR